MSNNAQHVTTDARIAATAMVAAYWRANVTAMADAYDSADPGDVVFALVQMLGSAINTDSMTVGEWIDLQAAAAYTADEGGL